MTTLKKIRRGLKALHNDTSGAMSVEKIMIIALIALPILIALWIFRTKLIGWFSSQSDQLQP
jgi:Flp pilus assembly pilin Flp